VRQLVLRGDFDRAVALLRPRNVKVLRDLGSEFFENGKTDLGLFCRSAAADLVPTDTVVIRELLRCLYDLGRHGDALSRAAQLDLSTPGTQRHDLTPEEKVIYSVVGDIAIASPELVAVLVRATEHLVETRTPGAFVECGVFRGGSAMALMMALRFRHCNDRDFYLYDTFAGMPVPTEKDVYHDGRPALEEWLEKRQSDGNSGWVVSTLSDTRKNIQRVGYPEERVVYVEGLVEDTIPARSPDRIAMLRLDTDFYSSTKHELEHLYPRLSSGGVLIIDDYGAFRGSKQAVDEFFGRMGSKPYLHRVDANVRILIKD
jgi:predicted O-methyltransferase YrrM